jgi:NADH dehydrogenase
LEVPDHDGVYALGDCASITDPNTGKPYPPTAQHAIRQGKAAAKNIISAIKGKTKRTKFDYKTKGMMAELGKRTGVATIFGIKSHGFISWWLWRTYYLGSLPTFKKKLKVMGDWTLDLVSKPGVAMIKRSESENNPKNEQKQLTTTTTTTTTTTNPSKQEAK